jgi:hypothetical protein
MQSRNRRTATVLLVGSRPATRASAAGGDDHGRQEKLEAEGAFCLRARVVKQWDDSFDALSWERDGVEHELEAVRDDMDPQRGR